MADDLVAFLRARIAEQQEEAEYVHDLGCDRVPSTMTGDYSECDCGWPTRIRAEGDAKQEIATQYVAMRAGVEVATGTILAGATKVRLGAYETALRYLALPYAGHPDYRSEWAPQGLSHPA